MSGDQLQRYLRRTTTRRVSVTLADDPREIVRAGPSTEGKISLRLHGSFLDAPSRVLQALVRFLRTPEPRLRRRVERLYRSAGLHRVGGGEGQRRVVLRHKGVHFNLKELFDGLNARHFDGRLKAFVTWGRRTNAARRSRSIHFGSFNWDRRVIRVHPDLDRDYVPRYFIESVLYHEMLHVDLGVTQTRSGRRLTHSREFQRREREGPDFDRAKLWERAHLHHFLRGAARSSRRPDRAGSLRSRPAERSAARRGSS
jgi:hypothetical protein